MQHRSDQPGKIGLRLKRILLGWVTVMMLAVPVAGTLLVVPQPASAQIVCPNCSTFIQDLGFKIKEFLTYAYEQGAAIAFKNAVKVFVSQIAYDTAVWIGSGDANQKPLLFTKDAGEYLADVGDAAAGEFLNTLFEGQGYINFDVCAPIDVNAKLTLDLLIGVSFPNIGIQLPNGELPQVECTLSDIVDNFQEASFNPDFATNISLIFIPSNNDFGVYATAVGKANASVSQDEEQGFIDRSKNDFSAVSGKVSGYIATPSSAVEHQYFLSLDASSTPQTTYTGKLFADTLDLFTSTLISKLLERLKNGLIADFTTPDISVSLSGSGSTSGGVKAAEEKFLTFKEVPLTRGSALDILSQLATCPDSGKEVTNCVIDEGFRSAIEQGKTVRQALDEGLIDGTKPFGFGEAGAPIEGPDQGIPYRSTIVLKHYRIVPVGWQIAAEYIRDFGGGSSVTLQDLVDAYDQCDSTTYSPFCKLVDPDWVLTSPAGICNLQAYGQNILSSRFEDDDGLNYTPERSNVLRAQSCVDDQSCLKEDSNGNCIAYGYCTEERRIYNFVGDQCPEQYSSCETYSDSNGDEVSYLRNTINFNNCDSSSVGCEWYCSVYNDINQDWQCADNGDVYQSCDSTVSTYSSTTDTCTCTADDATTCDMVGGAFKCTTSSGEDCTFDTQTDAETGVDSAINFNNQVKTCSADDAGCHTYIRTTTGANLIQNSGFEYFDTYSESSEESRGDTELTDTTIDTFGFYAADATTPGEPCISTDSIGTCTGWQTAGRVFATGTDPYDGLVAAEIQPPGSLTYTLETGYALANRTFDLVMSTRNTGSTDCGGEVELNGAQLSNPSYTGVSAHNYNLLGGNEWAIQAFDAYTFPSTTTATELSLVITVPNGCSDPVDIDAVELVEGDDGAEYTDYDGSSEEIYLNADRLECSTADIGCELFTPVTGSSSDAVPGQITNPLSDACTGTDGFKNASCSQCTGTTSDSEFVGCDFYQEQPLENAAPVPDLAGFASAPTGTERAGIVKRTGYYCNNSGYEGESCYDDADCGGTAGAYTECVDSVSVIPSTADTCSATYVGCEEYTNLDSVAEGGEGLEYYSYIRQCVKDTQEQRDDGTIKTYVTFEGSDVSGYSLRSFNLRKSDVDAAPCTNLDLYGSTAESSSALCVDSSSTRHTCTSADVGGDSDCTEYIDPNTGLSYYAYAAYTITASDDCHGLRNTLDGRTYYSIPAESTSCPANQNLCREYKGSAGDDVFQAVNDDFETDVWAQVGSGTVEQSSESTAAGGHSMSISSAFAEDDLFTVTDSSGTVSDLEQGKTYIISLWIKEDSTSGGGLSIYFNSDTATAAGTAYAKSYFVENDVNSVSGDTVSLTTDWHKFTFGPLVLQRDGEADDQLIINWDDSNTIYVDNVLLEESDSQYLIKDTASTCQGYEGCQEYTDRAGTVEYLKSFTKLCEEQYVGCEALIDTANSSSPFSQTFNTDNDFDSTTGPTDDVIISEDVVTAYVNDTDNYCSSSASGCTEYGLPTLDQTTGLASSYDTVDLLNTPDGYGSTLCQTDALTCQEFTGANDEVAYFKDPGNRTCQYRQETDGTDFGWFITDTDVACPLFDTQATVGQPMGAVCDGGTRDLLFCTSDDDCPDDDATDTDTPHCRSDFSTDADADGYPDTGWTGTCSAGYSGCTEYQDANTDNLIPNGDFEEDAFTYNSTTGQTDKSDDTPDGIPDFWEVNLLDCDTFEQSDTEAHLGSYSVKLIQDGLTSTGDGIGCAISPEAAINIDTSKTYTLTATFLINTGFTTNPNPTIFSLGLEFFDADGSAILYDYNGDGQTSIFGDTPAWSLAAQEETIDTADGGTWVRFSGEIGNRLEKTWPSTTNIWGADVAYVKPFVYAYNPGGGSLYVDDVSLTENSAYFYVNTSVDGAAENDTNTCNGQVSIGDGCVAMRDVTSKDQSYLSVIEQETGINADFTTTACTLGATETAAENCRFNQDTADGNLVVKVSPDRECKQWLSCLTSSITQDSDGNDETTCLELGACDALSDSGLCADSIANIEDVSASTDLTYHSRANSNLELDAIKNASGYTTVGVDWQDSDGTCTASVCASDSPYEGQACTADADCRTTNVVQGDYPYNDMVEEGTEGLVNGIDDLLSFGDFEDVFCDQSPGDVTLSFNGISGYTTDTLFSSSRNKHQTCTIDDHCRNQRTEARLEELHSIDESDGTKELSSSINYSSGWCENPDAVGESYQHWSPSSTDTLISIIDYDPKVDFTNPSDVYYDTTPSYGSLSLDLNNVLYVSPSAGGEGLEYTLSPDDITNGNQYALSFTAAWAESAGTDDHVNVGIEYVDDAGTSTKDYFNLCNSSGCGETPVEMTTDMTSYALTMTAADKPENATSATLFFHENADTAFYMDDISMEPVLEINNHDLNDIARECRAYPAENALLCNYTDANGSVFAGIHGYCVENDALYKNKCVTWWPLEKISGESDTRTKTEVRYNGRVPLYMCLVAKGLQDLAVCDGGQRDGAFCSTKISDTDGSGEIDDSETDAGDAYCQGDQTTGECVFGYSALADHDSGVYEFPYEEIQGNVYYNSDATKKPLDYQSIPRQMNLLVPASGGLDGDGMYYETQANAVEQALTMADIQNIRLELVDGAQDAGDFNYAWPQLGDQWSLNEESSNSDQWFKDDGTTVHGNHCERVEHNISGDDGSILFVWDAIESTTDDPRFCDTDPFTMSVSNGGDASDGNFDTDTFYSWNGQGSDSPSTSKFQNDENVVAFKLKFTNGVLDYVQSVIWSAIDSDYVEAKFAFKYQLRESCSYVVQVVDENGETTPWMERMNGDTGYTLPTIGYGYGTLPTPYGAIIAQDGTPDTWDADGNDAGFFSDVSPSGLLIQRDSATDMSAAPFGCVGKCERPYCSSYDELNDPQALASCEETETDADGVYCSDEGYSRCSGAPEDSSGSAFQGSAEGIDYSNFNGTIEDFNDQLDQAAEVAREDLKTIFADLPGEHIWTRRHGENSYTQRELLNLWDYSGGITYTVWDEMQTCDSGAEPTYCGNPPEVNDIEINGQTGDVSLGNGESATLTFGATADANQEPILTVKVMWDGVDGEGWDDAAVTAPDNWNAAPSSSYTYTHQYNCDPIANSANWDSSIQQCRYEVRVQLEDTWLFCSGTIDASGTDAVRDKSPVGTDGCTSYDEFSSYVLVAQD